VEKKSVNFRFLVLLSSIVLLFASCLMLPSGGVKPGQRVQEDKVFVIGRVNFDFEIKQEGLNRSIWNGKIELAGVNGDAFEVVYVPWNEYFVIKLDRKDLDLIYMNLRTELKHSFLGNQDTVKVILFDYHLPPFHLAENDTFVYIGDMDHSVVSRNPYGSFDPRVSVVDRYDEVKEQFTGFIVDADGAPLVPKNVCRPVSGSRLSKGFDKVSGDTFKIKGRTKNDNIPFALSDGVILESGASIAVLAADNNEETLMITQEIRDVLSAKSSLKVIGEEQMENILPLYPASLLDDDSALSDTQIPILFQIGESLAVDYVYAITRKKAVNASQEKFLGSAPQIHLWEYGVLCETGSSRKAGHTDYYVISKERSLLGGQHDIANWRNEREKEYREFTAELSGPIAQAIIEAVE
jgi:hypothetical protein